MLEEVLKMRFIGRGDRETTEGLPYDPAELLTRDVGAGLCARPLTPKKDPRML